MCSLSTAACGPYLGINVGYSAGKSKTDAVFSDATAGSPLFATGSSDNLNGVIAGFQGGYNGGGRGRHSAFDPEHHSDVHLSRRDL
jgi:hypothetical protein